MPYYMYLEIDIMLLLSDVVNVYFLNSKMEKNQKKTNKPSILCIRTCSSSLRLCLLKKYSINENKSVNRKPSITSTMNVIYCMLCIFNRLAKILDDGIPNNISGARGRRMRTVPEPSLLFLSTLWGQSL